MSRTKNYYYFEEDFFLAPESDEELIMLLEESGLKNSIRFSNMDSDSDQ